MVRKIVKQRSPYGKSTIAMSAYNAIALNGGKATFEEILEILITIQHPELKSELLQSSIDYLVDKDFIRIHNDKYCSRDPERRMIVSRDISDIYVDVTGIPRGGWNKWMIKDTTGKFVPAEEAINGVY